jgi:hypothetical protein
VVGEVTPQGVTVLLKPDAARFDRAGDYQVTLTLEGKAGASAVTTPLRFVLQRPAPEINLDDLKDLTVMLRRSWPLGVAGGTVQLPLEETTGLADLTAVEIETQALYKQNAKVQVSGKVTTDLTGPITIPAGKQRDVVVTLSDLSNAGALTTRVVVSAPALTGRKVIDVKVLVADRWGWALVAIAVGVVGGYLTHFFVETWRPRRMNAYTIVRLRSEVNRRLGLVTRPDKQDKLAAVAAALRDAEEKNDLGQGAAAQAVLAKAEESLDAIRKEELAEKTRVWDQLTELRARLAAYRQRRSAPTPEEQKLFGTADARFGKAQSHLASDEVDRAVEDLEAIRNEFEGAQDLALKQLLDGLHQDLQQVPGGPGVDDRKAQLEGLITAARDLVTARKYDDAWAQVPAIARAIQDLRRQGRGGRPDAPGIVPEAETPAVPAEPRLVALDPANFRLAGATLSFRVEAPPGFLQSGDRFRWFFGEGAPGDSNEPNATHRYREEGGYWVKVQVLREPAGTVVAELGQPLTVLPGRTSQQLQTIRDSIRAADFALAVVALILATLTGLMYLYLNKPFGSLEDYLAAILWGFGIDSGVRGFSAVMKRIGTPGG